MNVVPSPHLVVPLSSLSDDDLLKRLAALLKASRRVEAVLVAHIAEVDARRLYAREGSPSMFAYCTDALQLSEPEAYLRISVARGAREHPAILVMLADGRLHLSGIAKLVPHLTPANSATILQRAARRSKRQIEELVAELMPRPIAPEVVRRLPEKRLPPPGDPVGKLWIAPAPPPEHRPPRAGHPAEVLAPDRYRIQFTANAAFCEKLDSLKDLLRSSLPNGGLFALLDHAVSEVLARLEGRKFGLTRRPRKHGATRVGDPSRHVPADVRRAVFARDEGRCRFAGPAGQRCPARRRLEFHHVEPYARGGASSLANIRLMCRTHNAHLAETDFGAAHMERFRKGAPSRPPPAAPSRA